MVIIPAYPLVVLGRRVECPELRFTEEGAAQVLKQLVSPTFPRTLYRDTYLCHALAKTSFPSAWVNSTSSGHSYPQPLETHFIVVNKKIRYMGVPWELSMYRARLQWARHIAASIIDAMYEPVVRTGFNNPPECCCA